jgi:hypothetical protein
VSGFRLQRVDSSPVVETSNKLKEGMTCGNEYKRKKMLKYTISYDGMYGSCAATHTEEKYASESLALPENVIAHFKKSVDHAEVYVFDRGQSSTESFREMKSHKGLLFAGRLLENRKLHIVRDFDLTFRRFQWGEPKQDAMVYLYKKETVEGKNGTPVRRQALVRETYHSLSSGAWKGRYCFDNRYLPSSSGNDSRDVPSPVGY